VSVNIRFIEFQDPEMSAQNRIGPDR